MVATAPVWVSDVGVWAGAFVAVASVVGIAWTVLRRTRKLLVAEVREIVDERVAPMNAKLDHLHDCTEGVKADVEVVRVELSHVKADVEVVRSDVAQVKADTVSLKEGQSEIIRREEN